MIKLKWQNIINQAIEIRTHTGAFNSIRWASRTTRTQFYDVLHLTPSATQNDIKTAYYKLSMKYHPDRNRDSKEAETKFREITEAYEVLGNYKLRKLYDKGILHTAGSQYQNPGVVYEEEDDAQTRFYKARMHKEKPTATGKTPIYDYDEWTKNHYGENFDRMQRAKQRYQEKMDKEERHRTSLQIEYILVGIFAFVLAILVGIQESTHFDDPKITKPSNDKSK